MNKKIIVTLISWLLLVSCGINKDTDTTKNVQLLSDVGATVQPSTTPPEIESTTTESTATSKKTEISNTSSTEVKSTPISKKIEVTILTDTSFFKNEKNIDGLITRIKGETFLKDATITVLDYNKSEDKDKVIKVMSDNKLTFLPAVILNTKELNDNGVMTNSLSPIDGTSNYKLEVGEIYNPITKEVKIPDITRK